MTPDLSARSSFRTIDRPYLFLTLLCLPVFAIATFTSWHWEITPDDSYYYFTIARELVDNGILSFDGQTLASGFHPLWLAFCTFVYFVAGEALPRAINVVALACYIAYALFWYLSLKRLEMEENARRVLFAFGVVNAPIAFAAFSGMETSLVLAAAAGFFYTLVRTIEKPDYNPYWLSGAVAVLFLARLDSLLFAAPVLAWLSLRDIRRLFVPMLILGGVVAGYMAASYFVFGSLVPSSTSALRLIWYPVWLEREVPWAATGYFLDFPSHLLVTLRSAYWDIKMALGVAGFIFDRSWPAHIVVVVLAGLAVAGIRWRLSGSEGKSTQATVRLWLAAMLCCGIAIYIYACVVRLGGPREWYLQGPGFLTLAAAALAVSIRPKRWRPSRILLGAQVVLFVVTIPGFVANSWLPLNRAGVARDALQMIGPGAIGAFNAGIYGWGSGGIVNLDGLVNEDGYKAIRDRNLAGYLRQSPITHILDVDDAKNIRSIISHLSARPSPGLTVIREWPDQNGFRHRLYRLDWPD